jgi:hypothetical protein
MAALPRLLRLRRFLHLLCWLIPLTPVSAQSTPAVPHSSRLWLTTGLGLGWTSGPTTAVSTGLAGSLGLTYQPGVMLFTARTGGVWNLFRGDRLVDVALLIGAGTHGHAATAFIAAGPALAGGDLRTFQSSRATLSSQLGLGLQIQVLALPLASVGAGVTGFANINARQSFGGLLFSLGLGQLH